MMSRHHDYPFQVLNSERGCCHRAALAYYFVSEADLLLSNMRPTLNIIILMFVSNVVRYDKSANLPRVSKLSLYAQGENTQRTIHKLIHWV